MKLDWLDAKIPALPGWQLWGTVWLPCFGMIVTSVDRTNLSIAVADKSFKAFFRLSNIDAGALNSAFFWTYAVLQIPAGFLVDRFGVKKPPGA